MENNSIIALRNYGMMVDPTKPLELLATESHNARSLVLSDESAQASASVVQTANKLGNALDTMICRELAFLKRMSAHKDAGYSTFAELGEAMTGRSRGTINSYTNAGETFFTADGNPVKPFVEKVSVAVLNQLSGIIKNPVYVYRAKVDYDFLEVILKHYAYNLTTAKLNDLIKILKRGEIPSDLVVTEVKEDGTHFYLCDSDIELVGYTFPEEKATKETEESKETSESKESKESKETEKSISEIVSDAITALGKLPMNEDLKARYDVMYSAILNLTADIVAYKPTATPTEKGKEVGKSKETKKK